MARPRKYTDAIRDECEAVARMRDTTPSDKELALKHDIPASVVRRLMDDYRNEETRRFDPAATVAQQRSRGK